MSADAVHEVVHEPEADRFVLRHGGREAGELTYQRAGNRAALLHTEVLPQLRGQGLARQLVLASVQWARAEKIRLTPVCWYTKVVLERSSEFVDVL
jgi:uncharacterized protein